MRKKPVTPRSRVRSSLRQLWLRSRERALALKLADRRCVLCGVKASVAKGREVKVEVHHLEGVGNWDAVLRAVYEELLVSPDKLQVLCVGCHAKKHDASKFGL